MKKWKPTKVNDKWVMSTVIKNCIAIRKMKWWERVIYWKMEVKQFVK